MDLITVILPAYKNAQTLHACIQSICAQTYTNLEILVVDDGSPDDCGLIADEEARKDDRIRVFHFEKNRGVSVARNRGLDEAHGSYISFCDADDTMDPVMLEKLHALCVRLDADAALMACRQDCTQYYPDNDLFDKNTFMELLLSDRIKSYMPFGLYRSELFEGLRLKEEYRALEDTDMYYILMERAKRVAGMREIYYRYDTESPTGVTRRRGTTYRLYPASLISFDKYGWAKDRYPSVADELLCQAVDYADITCILLYHEKDLEKLGNVRAKMTPYAENIAKCGMISGYKKSVAADVIAEKYGRLGPLYYLHDLKKKLGMGR